MTVETSIEIPGGELLIEGEVTLGLPATRTEPATGTEVTITRVVRISSGCHPITRKQWPPVVVSMDALYAVLGADGLREVEERLADNAAWGPELIYGDPDAARDEA